MKDQLSNDEEFSPGESVGTDDATISDVLAATPLVLTPGQIIQDKFKVIELLGKGGMGTVYRVEHLLVGRQYALKCLSKYQPNDGNWRRFQNEAKAAHMLDHPNLLRFYEFGLLSSGQPFFLMELVDGVTLSDEIKNLGHIPLERALRIFIQVAFAIQYAHEYKVIHRDLKPSNIMLVRAKQEHEKESVKVVDFGIAKLTGVDEFNQQTLTKTGEIFGSPLYMSPEQCLGIGVDHRSDLYSLGCVFYESLTGAPPFIGESALSTMMKHQTDTQLSLKEASLGLEYPQALENIVNALLEKNPSDRYQSATALAHDLIELERKYAEKSLIQAATPIPKKSIAKTEPPPRTSKPISPTTTIGSSVGAFILGVGLCYAYMSQHHQPLAQTPAVPKSKKTFAERIEKAKKNNRKWSTFKNSVKVFEFPERDSLGLLVLKNNRSFAACETVTLQASEPLALLASNYLLENPNLFDQFREDDLDILDFGDSVFAKTPAFRKIALLTGLNALNVSGTAFSNRDFVFLREMPNLRHLNMAISDITCAGLMNEPFLSQLNLLDVSGIEDGAALTAQADKLTNIQQLALAGCALTDEDLTALAKCPSLKVLTLALNSRISDKGVANLLPLKQLEWVDLSMTSVTPACVESLKLFPKLKKVEIAKRLWTDFDQGNFQAVLKKHNPNIEVYYQDLATFDGETCIPGLPWKARGLVPHINIGRVFQK